MDWASFLKHHNLVHSMSRRGNCHDNAVAESFFNLLKRERIWRRVYRSRDEARLDVFNYIEMFSTRNANTSGTGCCRQSSSRSSRKSNPRVSTKLRAIQMSLRKLRRRFAEDAGFATTENSTQKL